MRLGENRIQKYCLSSENEQFKVGDVHILQVGRKLQRETLCFPLVKETLCFPLVLLKENYGSP